MLTIDKVLEVKHCSQEEYVGLMRRHCQDVFDSNAYGYFDNLRLVTFGFDVNECGVKMHFICTDGDDCRYDILLESIDGMRMEYKKCFNPMDNAKFGEKFLTVDGDVVIYYERKCTDDAHGGCSFTHKVLSSKYGIYEVDDKGHAAFTQASDVRCKVCDDVEESYAIKCYAKKEMRSDSDEYERGFLDGYKSGVVGLS